MELLFAEKGIARLDRIVRPGMLCAFDFDGTLAPIVEQPEAVCLPDDMRARLVELSSLASVAIITGRSVKDARRPLRFDPDYVVGNHGMEGLPGADANAQRHIDVCAAWRQALARRLHDEESDAGGIWIEDKGHSLSLHYRAARDHDRAVALLKELFAQLTPAPRVIGGKCVFNLLPQDAIGKGRALERLMRIAGAPSAIYVGDDETDEDVFRLRRPDLLSVRVEFCESSAAECFVPAQQDVLRLIDILIERLRDRGEMVLANTGRG
jgi:trehalose 6-phosphate phosphatase